MYLIYVLEDLNWKLESLHTTVEKAEFQQITMSYQDNRDRVIKALLNDA